MKRMLDLHEELSKMMATQHANTSMVLKNLKALASVVIQDDKKSRLLESSHLFGVPMTHQDQPEHALMPVMPRSLRALVLPEDIFNSSKFDQLAKQRMLASMFVILKSDRILRDSERWSSSPNVNASSHKYCGPLRVRLR